ncbi:DEAD/DEAH box helicase [Sorangium sp. KYC3313]|uniref:DEAD/DEAH box helicase n=1 Tax=Sorangium sp. KYC3313 TaxID=3449740 RepID=UPI003F8BA8A5
MSAFDRLSSALQYQIANTLSYRALRPVQEAAIGPVLDGKNAVVLAPTAGGKTEAAFFPLLASMDTEDWRPVSVLYLSPIRALLNNQEERVAKLAGLVGRRSFKWHGDTTPSARKAFLRDPADILLITPESLEAMLISPRVPTRELFAGLRTVVIDEVHSFAADDRGAHLSSLMERLTRYCGRDVQRVGLSATVGNPGEILRWIQGSSQRVAEVVDPKGSRIPPDLALDYVATLENAAMVVKALHPGKKRLVFVDSRRTAEGLGHILKQLGVTAFVSHGSLSFPERRDAERAFQEGRDCVIVATSALELGIDVGDLDHVLQIDSPPSVASFLQRMGRTGRRDGVVPNCTFLVTKEMAVLQAAAIIRLYREGFVEDVRPSRRATHILAHQLMGLSIQASGIGRGDWWAWLEGATAFDGIRAEERSELVQHMLDTTILSEQGGKLWLGVEGEKRYGRANFRELYAVFDVPRLVTVRSNTEEIGTVDALFLMTLDSDREPASFTLAGRAWEILSIDWKRGICAVRPASAGRPPRWAGGPQHLRYELCQAMRRVLLEDAEDTSWSPRARNVLSMMRTEHTFLRAEAAPVLESQEGITWWTFAGGGANLLLARMLEAELGGQCVSRNHSITLKGEAGKSIVRVQQVLAAMRAAGQPTEEDALRHAEGAGRSRVSKFQPCLPDRLMRELLVAGVLDVKGARRSVGGSGTETTAPCVSELTSV